MKPEKTLGDVIQEALKRASESSESTAGSCTCMHCSGNTVYSQELKMSTLTVALSQGTTTAGADELELTVDLGKAQATVIKISGDTEVSEFRNAIEELFV